MALRIVPDNTNIDFGVLSKYLISFSVFLVIISVLLVSFKGISFGIDFTGGVVIELQSEKIVEKIDKVTDELRSNGFRGFSINGFNDDGLMIRLKAKNSNDQISQVKKILEKICSKEIVYRKVDYVGSQIGSKQVLEGILAIICAFLGMFFYLWIRFNWQIALGGVLSLIHDAILTLGFISLSNIEFNLSSTAALLTVIGYSINDSVVIYDRMRELLKKMSEMELTKIINVSINSTLSRTVLTSTTTVLASIPLVLLCKGSVRDLSLVILFGIVIGTYSSIFIAAPVLLLKRKVDIDHK